MFFFQLFIIFAPLITNLDFTSMFNKQITTMKKRLLLLFSALAVVVAFTALTACGDDDNDDNGKEPSYYMCTNCIGTGKINCDQCSASGVCRFCNGDGTCDLCNGHGHGGSYWDSVSSTWVQDSPPCEHLAATVLDFDKCACVDGSCYPCSGRGSWDCPNCQGKGYIGDYPGGGYNNGGGGNDNGDSGDSGGGDSRRKCAVCKGTGICSLTIYHCQGSKKCHYCGGDGWDSLFGDPFPCSACNIPGYTTSTGVEVPGDGKCGFCGGTGDCRSCGGSGYKN